MQSLYERLDSVVDRSDNAALSEAFLSWLDDRTAQSDMPPSAPVVADIARRP